ncbi:Sorbosone dehydrogenase-domain-containing protein [Hyaloraphidium curvatum]|nr:Sorbosone dehydrogenase-domain-containing protein [Hyaloraphidium curvatum]
MADGDFPPEVHPRRREGRRTGSRRWLGLSSLVCLFAAALAGSGLPRGAVAYPSELPEGFFSTDIVNNLGTSVSDFCVLDANRVVVLQRMGVMLMVKNGELIWDPVLDLTDVLGAALGDRGLTSCTLHPDFAENGWIYLGYVFDDNPTNPTGTKKNRISRFTIVGDKIDRVTEQVILGSCAVLRAGANDPLEGDDCMPTFGITHNIGWLNIGPDNMLWAAVGEGIAWEGEDWVKSGFPQNWLGPMDPDYLSGKILRMDWEGNGLPDNPWYDGKPLSARSRVWAVGLRNPFRCNHVPNSNSYDLLCGVVGWFTTEAIHVVKRGANLGWPCFEGTKPPTFFNQLTEGCMNFYEGNSPWPGFDQGYIAMEWDHNGASACAMGGTFMTDKYPEAYQGSYIYGDFSLEWMSTVAWDVANSKPAAAPIAFAKTTDGPVAFKVGPDGWIWYLAQCVTCVGGGVLRAITYGEAWTPAWGTTYTPPRCDRPLDLVLPALPPGWQTAMYLSDLPASYFTPITSNGEWRPVANGTRAAGGDGQAAQGPVFYSKDSSIGTGNLDGRPMNIGGHRVRKGLGVRAVSNIEVDLQGACYGMYLKAGIDDARAPEGHGELVLFADNRVRWNSTRANRGKFLSSGMAPLTFDIGHASGVGNLLGVRKLRLFARAPVGFTAGPADQIDWGEMRVFCGPEAPYVPRLFINAPESDLVAKPGELVFFTGGAKDWKGNAIPWQNLEWTVNIVHGQGGGSHIHPALFYFPQTGWGSFQVEPHTNNAQEYYYFEIRLNACDPNCIRSCNFVTTYLEARIESIEPLAFALLWYCGAF